MQMGPRVRPFGLRLGLRHLQSICEQVCLSDHTGAVRSIEASYDSRSPYLSGIQDMLETERTDAGEVIRRWQATVNRRRSLS